MQDSSVPKETDEVAHRQTLDVVQFLLRAGEIEEQFVALLQQTLT